MRKPAHHTFETPGHLHAWLRVNHASQTELWVRIYKKATGQPTVTWDDCVVAAIAWGWIDGLRNALDDTSFLQRMTPRRARSNWSQKIVNHAERLIAQGRMQAAGLAQVEAARSDGRWATAYVGSATMVIPEVFGGAAARPRCARFFIPRSNARACSPFTTGCTAPSGRKPGRSGWWRYWRSWHAAKALEICCQREGRANASSLSQIGH